MLPIAVELYAQTNAKRIFAEMEEAFESHLKNCCPNYQDTLFLVAVSGGVDSMVLTHLLLECGVDLALAHCNFMLRGEESDADADAVVAFAKERKLSCFKQSFDTKAYAKENAVSTQMAARELRYSWFSEVMQQHGFEQLLTAHHADDDLETFFINLSRGSGIDGLTGIPSRAGKISRPLLPFSREEILAYAKKNKIAWREDSSNAKTDYLRNALRHEVIPKLKTWSPSFLTQWQTSQQHLQQAAGMLEDYLAMIYPKLVRETFQGYEIDLEQLQSLNHVEGILYYLLRGFGFTAWSDVYALPTAQSGKQVFSATHRLLKDRGILILTPREDHDHKSVVVNEDDSCIHFSGGSLKISAVAKMDETSKEVAYFRRSQLQFPLQLRKWQEGDYFHPFGMQNKKKLSKFFKDEKFSIPQKEAVWLLCSAEDIIWVVGHRSDNRYRVNAADNDLLKFEVFYES